MKKQQTPSKLSVDIRFYLFLKDMQIKKLAQEIDISSVYLGGIIKNRYEPSRKLERKIREIIGTVTDVDYTKISAA